MKNEKSLKIIPMGAVEGIGKNITLMEYGNDIIIIDCGIMFPGDEHPGINFIIPDFRYIEKNASRIRAVVITHGHEDHIGALPFLLQKLTVPIYATRLTIGLIQSRLQERLPKEEPQFHEIAPRDSVKIGVFSIEFIRVNHSIIDGVALAIKTPVGTVIHTGDFKIDFSPVDGLVTDLTRFAHYGEEGVNLLMSDSTNAENQGYTKSESVLLEKLTETFASAKGRIIVATFASNIHRIQQVLDVAQKYNRNVIISGMSMQKNVEIAHTLGYLNYKKGLIIDIGTAGSLPAKKTVIIGTGSQGEPMSALSRMATGTHRHFSIKRGDTVIITASVIPGNEKTVRNVVNSLMKQGADVIYEKDDDFHVSGHASAEELKLMITLVKPNYFVPIHGEYKHLRAHSQIAESLGIKSPNIIIPENGSILELTKKSFKTAGSIPLSQIYVDGDEVGDIDSTIIRDRQIMSDDGIIVVTVTFSNKMLVAKPEILTRGFIGNNRDDLVKNLKQIIEEQAGKLLSASKQPEEIKSRLSKTIQNSVYKTTRRNPIIEIIVIET